MATQAVYVHGSAAVARFAGGGTGLLAPGTDGHRMAFASDEQNSAVYGSDFLGLRGPHGVTFCGIPGTENMFFVPVPTPVWRDGVRAQLKRVGIKWKSDLGVEFSLRVSDGAEDLSFQFPPRTLGGSNHLTTWDQNVNFFDDPAPKAITSCVCVIFDVKFSVQGNFTIAVVGCDFEV